jgi:hypothetical protein
MIYFLDTEFNGFGGELISIALVSLNGDKEFYQVLSNPGMCLDPWVKDNVIPILGDHIPQHRSLVQSSLNAFFDRRDHQVPTIIVDWPADVSYFCDLMLGSEPGTKVISGNFNFTIDRNLSCSKAEIRHNALSDARALREDYIRKNRL